MGILADKLSYLDGTKTAIKNAIIAKGVDVEDTDTFRAYADKIGQIEGGGGIPEYERYSIVDDGATSVPHMPKTQAWFMSKVYIPPSVTEIGNYFVTQSAITEMIGADNVLTFYDRVFYGCTLLTTISLPSVTNFSIFAFYQCALLVTIDLPSVTQFGTSAFRDCPALANIDLGSRLNVLTIGSLLYLQSVNLTVASFLQVGNALVDNTGSAAKTIYVTTVAWDRLSTAQKAIFTNKNYTVNVS